MRIDRNSLLIDKKRHIYQVLLNMDGMMFRYSEKGSHELSHQSHKHGGDKAGRGRAKGYLIAVLVAKTDSNQHLIKDLKARQEKSLSITQSAYR